MIRNSMSYPLTIALVAILCGCAGNTDVSPQGTKNFTPQPVASNAVGESRSPILPVIKEAGFTTISEGGPESLNPNEPGYSIDDDSLDRDKVFFAIACTGDGQLNITDHDSEVGTITCTDENQELTINFGSDSNSNNGVAIHVTAISGSATIVWKLFNK